MLSYYAVGGGLGHLTRALAILAAVTDPRLLSNLRILTSGRLASLVRDLCPVPLDIIPQHLLTSRRAYYEYLEQYLSHYDIKGIILDTFPWGIVGEWLDVAPGIPRFLIARSLKWQNYYERVRFRQGPMPHRCLVIEPLESAYREILIRESRVTVLREPILWLPSPGSPVSSQLQAVLSRREEENSCNPGTPGWLVVHSGDKEEREVLLDLARKEMNRCGGKRPVLQTVFPEQGIFPAQALFPSYSVIISGAGYNMAAAALLSPPHRKHILFPFERKFDDQQARITQMEQGTWCTPKTTGAQKAAQWLPTRPGEISFAANIISNRNRE